MSFESEQAGSFVPAPTYRQQIPRVRIRRRPGGPSPEAHRTSEHAPAHPPKGRQKGSMRAPRIPEEGPQARKRFRRPGRRNAPVGHQEARRRSQDTLGESPVMPGE